MLPSKPWRAEALAWLLMSLFFSLALVGLMASLADRWLAGPLMFSTRDIQDLDELASQLRNPSNTVSQYLVTRLSAKGRKGLEGYAKGDQQALPFEDELVKDLNKVLAGPRIYDTQRFSSVRLRPETERLLGTATGRLSVRHLNRLLLEDAYPAELRRSSLSELATQSREIWLQIGFTPLFQVVTFLLVGYFLRKSRMTWMEAFGFKRSRLGRHLALAVGTIAIVLPVCLGLLWLSQKAMEWRSITPEAQTMVKVLQTAHGWDQYLLLGVTAMLMAPVWEEVVFRGILFTAVRQGGFPNLAWIGTSLLFAASHANLMTFVPLFAFGAAMVWLYRRTENLLAPIVGHALFNGLNFGWMVIGGPTV